MPKNRRFQNPHDTSDSISRSLQAFDLNNGEVGWRVGALGECRLSEWVHPHITEPMYRLDMFDHRLEALGDELGGNRFMLTHLGRIRASGRAILDIITNEVSSAPGIAITLHTTPEVMVELYLNLGRTRHFPIRPL